MQGRRKTTKTDPLTASHIIQGEPPEWLHNYAKETWIRTLRDLNHAGRNLDVLDLESFVSYCVAAGTVRQCSEVLDREGLTVQGGRDGTRKHPACSTMNAAASQVRQFAAELGLSAASRGRLPSSKLSADDAETERLRQYDPEAFAKFVATHGRLPESEFDLL